MKHVTVNRNKRSRQERALAIALERWTHWTLVLSLTEDERPPRVPNARNNMATFEQKLQRARQDVKNLNEKLGIGNQEDES